MRYLDHRGGECGCSDAALVGERVLGVFNADEQPADGTDWSAQETLWRKVAAYRGRAHSVVDGVPISGWSAEDFLRLTQELLRGGLNSGSASFPSEVGQPSRSQMMS